MCSLFCCHTLKSAAKNRGKLGVKENPEADILKIVTTGMARWRIDPRRGLWNNLPVRELLQTRLILKNFLFSVVFLWYAPFLPLGIASLSQNVDCDLCISQCFFFPHDWTLTIL